MDTRADKLIFEENFFNKNLFVENGGTLVGSSLSGGALVTPSGAANYAEFKDVTDIQAFFSGSGVIAFDFTLVESPSGFVAVGWVPHSLDQVVTMSVNSASQLYIEVRVDGVTNNYRVVTGVLELGKKYRIGIASYSASARLYVDGVLVDEDTTLQGQLLGSYPTTTDVTFGGFDATAGRNSAASIIDNIAIYADEWTQLSGNVVGDFLKDYLRTTFTETDIDANTPVWSDLNDKYSDGSNIVTTNKGTLGNLVLGDGAGNNEPTLLDTNGMNFAGGQYLTLADNDELDFANGEDFSLEFAIYNVTDAAAQTLIQKVKGNLITVGAVGSHGYDVLLRTDLVNNPLVFRVQDTNNVPFQIQSTTDIMDGGYHHVVCVFRWGSVAEIHINGEIEATSSVAGITGDLTNDGDLFYGRAGVGTTLDLKSDLLRPTLHRTGFSPRQIREMYQKFLNSIN